MVENEDTASVEVSVSEEDGVQISAQPEGLSIGVKDPALLGGEITELRAEVRADRYKIAALLVNAQTDATKIASLRESITEESEATSAAAHEAEKSSAAAQEAATRAGESAEASVQLRAGTEESGEVVASLAETAASTKEKVEEYERRLSDFADAFERIKRSIEGLLPGATSAGLASSFASRKTEFKKKQKLWSVAFSACMLGLVLIGILGSNGIVDFSALDSWDSFLLYLARRVPLAAPTIWLAIYAGRQHSLFSRLEEDYAYKEALSQAFEGYKEQMSRIETPEPDASPLLKFCNDILGALSRRPGMIYESRHEDITPINTLTQAAGKLMEGSETSEEPTP